MGPCGSGHCCSFPTTSVSCTIRKGPALSWERRERPRPKGRKFVFLTEQQLEGLTLCCCSSAPSLLPQDPLSITQRGNRGQGGPACSAAEPKPPLFRQSQCCGLSCSLQLPMHLSVQPWEGHVLLGLGAMLLGGGVLGPLRAVNMMSCGSVHSPLCVRVPKWASQVLRGRHRPWPTAKGTGVGR